MPTLHTMSYESYWACIKLSGYSFQCRIRTCASMQSTTNKQLVHATCQKLWQRYLSTRLAKFRAPFHRSVNSVKYRPTFTVSGPRFSAYWQLFQLCTDQRSEYLTASAESHHQVIKISDRQSETKRLVQSLFKWEMWLGAFTRRGLRCQTPNNMIDWQSIGRVNYKDNSPTKGKTLEDEFVSNK